MTILPTCWIRCTQEICLEEIDDREVDILSSAIIDIMFSLLSFEVFGKEIPND